MLGTVLCTYLELIETKNNNLSLWNVHLGGILASQSFYESRNIDFILKFSTQTMHELDKLINFSLIYKIAIKCHHFVA